MKKGSEIVSSLMGNTRYDERLREEKEKQWEVFKWQKDCLRDEVVVVKYVVTDEEWQITVDNYTKQ